MPPARVDTSQGLSQSFKPDLPDISALLRMFSFQAGASMINVVDPVHIVKARFHTPQLLFAISFIGGFAPAFKNDDDIQHSPLNIVFFLCVQSPPFFSKSQIGTGYRGDIPISLLKSCSSSRACKAKYAPCMHY